MVGRGIPIISRNLFQNPIKNKEHFILALRTILEKTSLKGNCIADLKNKEEKFFCNSYQKFECHLCLRVFNPLFIPYLSRKEKRQLSEFQREIWKFWISESLKISECR